MSLRPEAVTVEAISTFDVFKIGVGPSSSHTMGPWRAAQRFLASCRQQGLFDRVRRVRTDLYGSLAKTGKGHGTDFAVLLGLSGEDPVMCDTAHLHDRVEAIRAGERIRLAGTKSVRFHEATDLVFHPATTLPFHPNGLTSPASLDAGRNHAETYSPVGGGFVARGGEPENAGNAPRPPLPVDTAADLLRHCREQALTVPEVVRRNEL